MNVKLKHDIKKCWCCKYQAKINKLCAKEPFSIEYDFYKERGYFTVTESYIAAFKKSDGTFLNIPISPKFEVKVYKKGDAIDLINAPLKTDTIKEMIKEVKKCLGEKGLI